MTEENKNRRNDDQRDGGQRDIEIPAVRHVGPTLEADETKDGRELADAVDILRDASSSVSRYEPPPHATAPREDPEPLKTRLPGDTSSDPHTDVGRENAATVQHRGETNQK